MRKVHDHYFHEARRQGYRSRAAFKLKEIDDRRRVLAHGDRVLDVGCAPGSWIEAALERIGDGGAVVGIDLQPISPRISKPNVITLEGDFTTIDPGELIAALARAGAAGQLFSVVLSDMAPNTTGDPRGDHHRSMRLCEAILDRLPALLAPGGHLVMKCYEGEVYPDVLARTRGSFGRCKAFKPKASRSESVEMFIVAHGFRNPDEAEGAGKPGLNEDPLPPRRQPPSADWSR